MCCHFTSGYVLASVRVACVAVSFLFLPRGLAQVLYDGALSLPGDQGWSYLALGSATQTLTNNAVLLNTSGANSTQAGYSRVLTGLLNRDRGFAIRFEAQVSAEAHANNNRAGFSVIVLADDVRGIELGLWTNKIFAQSDSPLFTHAEDAICLTTNWVNYTLVITGTNYSLRADDVPLLSGPVRDYSAFSGLINPYRTPDFVFFGDDTTSAAASAAIRKVSLIAAPELKASAGGQIVWTGVPNEKYTLLSSSNLVDWTVAGSVTSPNTAFAFTNILSEPGVFFRLRYP